MARFKLVMRGKITPYTSAVKAQHAADSCSGEEQSSGPLAYRCARADETLRSVPRLVRGVAMIGAVFGVMGLSGCASPEVKGLCPGYVHYSKEDDAALLAELQAAARAGQPLPEARRYLRDDGKQRAALRVICKGN